MPHKFFDIEESSFNFQKEKQNIIDNLNFLQTLSVEEQTLYKKWIECKTFQSKYDSSYSAKFKIWKPTDIFNLETTLKEIKLLNPIIKVVTNDSEEEDWLNLRIFSHTMSFDQNPGRIIKFLVLDTNTGKYLGVASLGSDVTSLTVRDETIGWTDKEKYDDGKLNSTSIATTIMSTQPFGYNFLGGKLVAALLTTKTTREAWKDKYGDELVGLTTTSLYGPSSMYNGIPYWKSLGVSTGKVFIKPDDELYDRWHHWLQDNKPELYKKITGRKDGRTDIPVTGIKQKIITNILSLLDIKYSKYVHGFKRGVYFSPFYKNYKEFLLSQITADKLELNDRNKTDIEGVLDWWKNKAIKRYTKLHSENRINNELLFYNKLPFMDWDEVKEKYLKDVGR